MINFLKYISMQIWKEKKENPKTFETKEINQHKKSIKKYKDIGLLSNNPHI